MKDSAPNTWMYGANLERVVWEGDPATFRRWDGATDEVHPGETLLILQTGAPWATAVAVERNAPETP